MVQRKNRKPPIKSAGKSAGKSTTKSKGSRIVKRDPPINVTVQRLGAKGDGEAELEMDGKQIPLYIPFSLEGESFDVSEFSLSGGAAHATKTHRCNDVPDRVTAACPHFGTCGGCALQHLSTKALESFKTKQLIQALQRRGFEAPPLRAIQTIPAGARRRARFAARRTHAAWILGFNAAGSSHIVDQATCPAITLCLNKGRDLVRIVMPKITSFADMLDIQIDDAQAGLDIAFFQDRMPDLSLDERQALVDWAEEYDIARVSLGDSAGAEPVTVRRAITIDANGLSVPRAPGAFSQPSVEGASIIGTMVTDYAAEATKLLSLDSKKSLKALDLFSGGGALSVPLAKTGISVTAFDTASDQIAALNGAAGQSGLPLTAVTRDLFKRPLERQELRNCDILVFDPPRAGALEQSKHIAEARVPIVIAVSCNPTTLSRDLRILVDAGYTLHEITPIDQFAWSPHVEAVALLTYASR